MTEFQRLLLHILPNWPINLYNLFQVASKEDSDQDQHLYFCDLWPQNVRVMPVTHSPYVKCIKFSVISSNNWNNAVVIPWNDHRGKILKTKSKYQYCTYWKQNGRSKMMKIKSNRACCCTDFTISFVLVINLIMAAAWTFDFVFYNTWNDLSGIC